MWRGVGLSAVSFAVFPLPVLALAKRGEQGQNPRQRHSDPVIKGSPSWKSAKEAMAQSLGLNSLMSTGVWTS